MLLQYYRHICIYHRVASSDSTIVMLLQYYRDICIYHRVASSDSTIVMLLQCYRHIRTITTSYTMMHTDMSIVL
jgi:hypothetical protein